MVKNWSPGNGSQIDLIKNWYLEIGPKSGWSKTGLMETRMFKNPKEIGIKLVSVWPFGNGIKKKQVKNWYAVIGLQKNWSPHGIISSDPPKTAPAWAPQL